MTVPEGNDLALPSLDMPAAVDPSGVVQRPGRAVDHTPPLRMHLRLLTAACWTTERRGISEVDLCCPSVDARVVIFIDLGLHE